MITAYVLLQCEANKKQDIEDNLRLIGVDADSVFGPYDFVVNCTTDSVTELKEGVEALNSLPGMCRTLTLVVADSDKEPV